MTNINDEIIAYDKLLMLLHRKRYYRYRSASDLRRKSTTLAILWNCTELQQKLDACCSADPLSAILKRERNGVTEYKYNPENYKIQKAGIKFIDSLKTDEELHQLLLKKRSDWRIINWLWINIAGFVAGTIFGALVTVCVGLVVESHKGRKNKETQKETSSKTYDSTKSTKSLKK